MLGILVILDLMRSVCHYRVVGFEPTKVEVFELLG